MVRPRPLKTPPIKEALIDIKCRIGKGVIAPHLETADARILNMYPEKQPRRRVESQIELRKGYPPEHKIVDSGHDGFLYVSKQRTQVAQFTLQGFTFNRLKPYETWEALRDEARRLWSIYREVALPTAITSVSLRYLNHFELPLPIQDVSKYLVIHPNLPTAISPQLNGFLVRVIIPHPATGATGVLSLATEASLNPRTVPLILDIEVGRQGEFAADDEGLWDLLERFREFKNRVFFEAVTEKTIRLFL